jgi:NADPH:quinone reductase-like Zn-dependent oxidoreductase
MTATGLQMDALVMQAGGTPAEALVVRSETVPDPAPGEVLVEVHASGVNPFDVVIAAGLLGSPLPMIPGIDFAGTVVSEGEFHGQEVWGSQADLGWKRRGAHAQFVALPTTWLSRKPQRLTMTQAGAVGRPYLTAWQSIVTIMSLQPGETLLVTGGSGLVGQAATAVAHWRGANVIVADRRTPHGADGFVDTDAEDLTDGVLGLTHGRGVDAVLDTIGGELFEPAVKSLRFGGRMTGIHSHQRVEIDPSEIYDHDRHVTGLASVFIDGAAGARIFDQLAPLFERGLLTPPSTRTWSLPNGVEAYQRVKDGAHGVKQVLLPTGYDA